MRSREDRGSVVRRGWSRPERLALLGMAGVVVVVTALGWVVLALWVAPARYRLGGLGVMGGGLGLTAYLLGARHAFDADHIAAIDNTTRTLLAGRGAGRPRPLSVGFWFAVGHAGIVFVMVLLLGFGVRAVAGEVTGEDSPLRRVGGLVSTGVSGTFLVLVGLVNLVALVGIARVVRRMRSGRLDEAELERRLNERGLLARLLGGVTRTVRRPWQMAVVGLLFGLGFDTATEVTLLVIAGGAAAGALPWYGVLVLPVLFAAGMMLFDTLDGVLMCHAYDWAFLRPARKVFYNLVVTSLSVAVALGVGVVELLSLLAERARVDTGPLAAVAALDLGRTGFTVAGLFLAVWLVALVVWRVGRIEERWSPRPAGCHCDVPDPSGCGC